MGCTAHVVVVGGPRGLTTLARERLQALEARWSRFLPTSELSRLNAAAGTPCHVSPETFGLIERSIHGWAATGGAFDPTVLPALVAAGYDRTFRELSDDERPAGHPVPGLGCGAIRLDPRWRMVTMPTGTTLDPGGIGKGLAADLVVALLVDAGASGACVNVGGDIRVAGEAPTPAGWVVSVEDPRAPGRELDRFVLADGAVATSSTAVRSWRRGGRLQHHLIDPATGSPASSPALAATVVAGAGWWAEVLTKAALLAGSAGPGLLATAGAAGFVLTGDGAIHTTGDLAGFRPAAGHESGSEAGSDVPAVLAGAR